MLFGFYQGDPSKQIVFTVSSVDSQTGVAVLKPEVGGEWIASATDGDVYLIYTGLNTGGDVSYNYENLLFSENSFDVNTASQTGGRIPACMHAHAVLQIDGEGNKSLEFIFQNDCAIIELAGLTGIKEDYSIPEEAVLSKISVTGLFLDGKYSYDKEHNVLTFGANGNESKTVEIDFGDNSQWKVDETGNISGPEKILIAVVPKDDFTDITVNAKVSGTENAFNYTYSNKKISYTDCYVIAPADVVAKTVDGRYFSTVAAAFDHACEISSQHPYDNTVTLVKESIMGLGKHLQINLDSDSFWDEDAKQDVPYGYLDASLMVDIDYDVTLDLNGCSLNLVDDESCFEDYDGPLPEDYDPNSNDSSEYFCVESGVTFTITDSKKAGGTIESDSDYYIIDNAGVVTIYDGIF